MNVLIVDDHEVIRDGISMIMKQAYEIYELKSASDGYEAIKIVETFQPDLVLLDISMPSGLDGLSTLERLRKMIPKAKIVVFSMYDNLEYKKKASKYGANGYLIKKLKKDDFLQSLDQILFDQELFHYDEQTSESRALTLDDLELPITKREKEVFTLTVKGYSLKKIAEKLQISSKTVENHRQNISKKLGVSELHKWLEIAKGHI